MCIGGREWVCVSVFSRLLHGGWLVAFMSHIYKVDESVAKRTSAFSYLILIWGGKGRGKEGRGRRRIKIKSLCSLPLYKCLLPFIFFLFIYFFLLFLFIVIIFLVKCNYLSICHVKMFRNEWPVDEWKGYRYAWLNYFTLCSNLMSALCLAHYMYYFAFFPSIYIFYVYIFCVNFI